MTSTRVQEALRTAAEAQRSMACALDALAAAIGEVRAEGEAPATAPEAGKLLTVKQAAERLEMSPSWVYRAVEEGRLACVRIGNRVRLQPEAIEAFLADRQTGGEL